MAGVTDTQSLRFGEVEDVITHTMVRDLADDIALQLDAADVAQATALKKPIIWASRFGGLSLPVSPTITLVPWLSENQDTHAMLDIATQPTRFTASATSGTGVFMVNVQARLDTTGWTRGDMIFYKNGVFFGQKSFLAPQNLNMLQATFMINLGTVGDYITVGLYHEGGGSTSVSSIVGWCHKVSN